VTIEGVRVSETGAYNNGIAMHAVSGYTVQGNPITVTGASAHGINPSTHSDYGQIGGNAISGAGPRHMASFRRSDGQSHPGQNLISDIAPWGTQYAT